MYNIRYCKYVYEDNEPIRHQEEHAKVTNEEKKHKKDTKTDKQNVEPPPPRNISKEHLGLWIGWTYKTNRELIREAASKNQIALAETFLSCKTQIPIEEAKDFIKKEVFLWVDELLERKLIFRVTSILQSINLDPFVELQNVFYKTKVKDLREYIGNHLKNKSKLSDEHEKLWILLDIMIENKVLTREHKLVDETIQNLSKQPELWRQEIATKLFINIHDNRLVPILTAEVVWNQLCTYNEVDLLKAWIQISFSPTLLESSSINENIAAVFQSFTITNNMINQLLSSELPSEGVEIVLNELAKVGLFTDVEKGNFLQVISRINSVDNLETVYSIFGQRHSNLSQSDFFAMLNDFCAKNEFLPVLNACVQNVDLSHLVKDISSPHLNLICDFNNLMKEFNENILYNNIYQVAQYLCNNNIQKYLYDNSLIFLSLLLFKQDINIEEALSEKSLNLFGIDFSSCLDRLFNPTTLLGKLHFRRSQSVKSSLTYFDLLEKHIGIHVKRVYSYKFGQDEIPNFNTQGLKEADTYSKKLNYTFYLKLCRPCIASKVFYLDLLKNDGCIHEKHKELAEKKVYKLAVLNFNNLSLTISCVSFLEIIGVDSLNLRVSLNAANLLYYTNPKIDVVPLFLDGKKNACMIQALLEQSVVALIDFNKMKRSGDEFIHAVKLYDVVIKFSEIYNLPQPESFLLALSQNNLWFPFLLYAQIRDYPMAHVRSLCPNFKNPNLLEHIVHSVAHDIQVKETNVLMQERDSRKHLLSKLGVRKMLDKTPEEGSLHSRTSVSGSYDINFSTFADNLEIDLSNTKATLLQTLIRCHNSGDPPKALLQACCFYKNPLLAIFATSYEPDSVVNHWLIWLSVSSNLYETLPNIDASTTNPQAVSDLLNTCMVNGYARTLLESLIIFMPDNPLTPFVDALNDIIHMDYHIEYISPKLSRFTICNRGRRSSTISQTDYEMTFLKNRIWTETTALRLLHSALIYHTTSYFDQLQFVTLLCNINIQSYFSIELPKFDNLLKILKVLFKTPVKLNIRKFLDDATKLEAMDVCIDELINDELFTEALEIAKLCKYDTHLVVLRKWQKKYETRVMSIQEILELCSAEFKKENIPVEYVISFFKERITINDTERYFLLKFSHKWAIEYNMTNKYELEKKKIFAFLNIPNNKLSIDELSEFDDLEAKISYKEMAKVLQHIYPVQECLSVEATDKLNDILVKFLDQGKFWTALKLEKIFGCDNMDLNTLKLCYELAEGMVLPNQLSEAQKVLFSKVEGLPRNFMREHRFRTVSISSDKNQDWMQDTELDDSESQSTLTVVQTLSERIKHGANLGNKIFMKYRISRNLEKPYEEIISNTEPLSMLKNALQEDCANKLDVVHDFFEVFKWPRDQVTDFVCEQFVNAASYYTKSNSANFMMWDVRMDTHIHVVLGLFRNESYVLGYKFYNYAVAIHEQQATADLNFKIGEMGLVVELLIAAHFCFTTDCNMEGISLILRKSRTIISHLLTVRSWKLIVRLFTGVGRYSELNFIFDILKENQQFEFLLTKGSKRDDLLRQASFDFIKKQCPEEKELYRLVAIHFNMHSEVADLCENEGKAVIKQLVAITKMENKNVVSDGFQCYLLKKTDTVNILLVKAMDNYIFAAEYHTEGQKLVRGLHAVKQAELIALQKSLLRSLNQNYKIPCLFDLTSSQIAFLISNHLNFPQSNILIEAYNHPVDWAAVLFEQTIKNNNVDYFDSFMEIMGINEQIVQDMVRKYVASNFKDGLPWKNMMYVISNLNSVHSKYRIASEFGFTDLVQELISEGQISYLKDTVWKKGYKN